MKDPFSIQSFTFPKDFIWGSSTAGHQIEGDNIHSDWWVYEHEKIQTTPDWDMSGKACNSYEMYDQDAQILSDLSHQVYRMSMEWARLEPVRGQYLQQEVDHYIAVFESLKKRGIKIFLTLVHGTVPQWFKQNGWFMNIDDNLLAFEKYLNFVLPQIAKYIDFWNVLNEFNGGFAEGSEFKFGCMHYHAIGYHTIKKYSSAPVSSAHALVMQAPYRANDKFDRALAEYRDLHQNEFFFHAIRTGELVIPGREGIINKDFKDSVDFWSINTYIRALVDARTKKGRLRYPHERLQMIDKDFYLNGMDAECVIHNLTRLMDKPVIISENGCSCDNDDFRIVFILEYLCTLAKCIEMGVDVKGYLYWSLLDNYEWGSFKPRFGLVDVDRENNFKRTIKKSAYFYQEIIKNNGFNPEMLKKYLTELPKVEYEWKGNK